MYSLGKKRENSLKFIIITIMNGAFVNAMGITCILNWDIGHVSFDSFLNTNLIGPKWKFHCALSIFLSWFFLLLFRPVQQQQSENFLLFCVNRNNRMENVCFQSQIVGLAHLSFSLLLCFLPFVTQQQ